MKTMSKLKPVIKHVFYYVGMTHLLDRIVFTLAYIKNYKSNRKYISKNPTTPVPPKYFLYETFKLNYQSYFYDGDLSAREISEWTRQYRKNGSEVILEWGCGTGQIIGHMRKYVHTGTALHGCDINQPMIEWDKRNIHDVRFLEIAHDPPTPYDKKKFDFVFGISVLTHLEDARQMDWIKEIHRILVPGGIFLFTTHGSNYLEKLIDYEKKELALRGSYTKTSPRKGHRLMSTYNISKQFMKDISPYFDILEFYEGKEHINKAGGQDMWIVRKRAVN